MLLLPLRGSNTTLAHCDAVWEGRQPPHLTVAPDEAKVELVTRQADGAWLSTFITGLDREIPLESLDVTLPMAEIYDAIDLDGAGAST